MKVVESMSTCTFPHFVNIFLDYGQETGILSENMEYLMSLQNGSTI